MGRRENRCLKVHETRPSLISQRSVRLPIECPRFPKNTHTNRHTLLFHMHTTTYTKLSPSLLSLWTSCLFTVIYSSTLVKQNFCWWNKVKATHYLFMPLHFFKFYFVSLASVWITIMSVCLLCWKKGSPFHLSYYFCFNREKQSSAKPNLKRFIFGNTSCYELAS